MQVINFTFLFNPYNKNVIASLNNDILYLGTIIVTAFRIVFLIFVLS